MNENNLLRSVMLAITKQVKNARLFRNNTGTGWQGRPEWIGKTKLVLHDPRPLQAGLCPGSSDLIGWTTITITPEMVGLPVAVFTAVEAKTESGRVSDAQKIFIENVRVAGGIVDIVRTTEDAIKCLQRDFVDQTERP